MDLNCESPTRMIWAHRAGIFCSLYEFTLDVYIWPFSSLPIKREWISLSQGLSPDLQSMEQIRRIMRPTDVPDTGKEI